MALAGRLSVIAVSTAGTSFATIDDMNNVQFTVGGRNVDVTEFGDTFEKQLRVLSTANMTVSGFYGQADPAQILLWQAAISATQVYVMFKPNGTAGWTQLMMPDSLQITTTPTGAQELSVALMNASGTITTC